MDVVKEEGKNLTSIIKVQILEDDYKASLEKSLKSYRKQAQINGFRPGNAPMGLIKKMYGHYALVGEVNKLVSETLSNYIKEEKLEILGEPLPSESQKDIDWDTDKDFEFSYEIAISPEVEVKLTKKNKFTYYNIAIDEKMVDDQVSNLQGQFGSQITVDTVSDNDILRGDLAQVDENGNIIEGGIEKEDTSILLSSIKDEDSKNLFIGAEKDKTITYNPMKATNNETEVAAFIGVEKEENEEAINADYKFTIKEILHFEKAELNQELFDKIFGEGTIKSEDELKERLKNDISKRFSPNSDYKFMADFKEKQVDKLNIELPEEFLKRWLIVINEDNDKITVEQIEKDFPLFLDDLKWQMIKSYFIKTHDIKVETEDLKNAAKDFAKMQFAQFGMLTPKEEDLENWGNEMLKNKEEAQKLYESELDKKIIDKIKELVSINEKEVTIEEFSKLMEK